MPMATTAVIHQCARKQAHTRADHGAFPGVPPAVVANDGASHSAQGRPRYRGRAKKFRPRLNAGESDEG